MYLYLLENAKVFKQNPGELITWLMVVERMASIQLVTPNGIQSNVPLVVLQDA